MYICGTKGIWVKVLYFLGYECSLWKMTEAWVLETNTLMSSGTCTYSLSNASLSWYGAQPWAHYISDFPYISYFMGNLFGVSQLLDISILQILPHIITVQLWFHEQNCIMILPTEFGDEQAKWVFRGISKCCFIFLLYNCQDFFCDIESHYSLTCIMQVCWFYKSSDNEIQPKPYLN